MEWNVWDEQVRGMYAGEHLAPPAGIEAAVFRRLDRLRWMRRLAGGLVVSAVAIGGYVAMPATESPVVPQEEQQVEVQMPAADARVPADPATAAEVPAGSAAGDPLARRAQGGRQPVEPAQAVVAEPPTGAPAAARRLDPAQVAPEPAAGLQQRAQGEDRWVLPARIEVKD